MKPTTLVSTHVRWVPAMVVALLAVLLTPSAAHAANFSGTFGPSPRGGYGRITGSLTFTSKTTFNYNVYVEDVCPPDGYGVSGYFTWVHMNGSRFIDEPVVWDTTGCDDGLKSDAYHITAPRNINYVEAAACWTNDGNLCWAVPWVSNAKDNPYT